jgi:L-serine kinase (ADP)
MGKKESLDKNKVILIDVNKTKPIEKYNKDRIHKIKKSIESKGWIKPIIVYHNFLEDVYHVLDGHHRQHIAKDMNLKKIPAIVVKKYKNIKIRSLRPEFSFDHSTVIKNSLAGDVYPYKTVKHDFNFDIHAIEISITELH